MFFCLFAALADMYCQTFTFARFLSLAWSELRLCSANHGPGYWSNLPCDWPSTAWAYSEQETENRELFEGKWSCLWGGMSAVSICVSIGAVMLCSCSQLAMGQSTMPVSLGPWAGIPALDKRGLSYWHYHSGVCTLWWDRQDYCHILIYKTWISCSGVPLL